MSSQTMMVLDGHEPSRATPPNAVWHFTSYGGMPGVNLLHARGLQLNELEETMTVLDGASDALLDGQSSKLQFHLHVRV